MQSPLAASVTVTTPGGKSLAATHQRTVTLAVASDLLSLSAQTDTSSVNGRISTTTFDAATRTLTATSAEGRHTTVVVDERGRPVQARLGDLDPTSLTYDGRGRLATAGSVGRISGFTYGGNGFLASITHAMGRTVSFARDADGRVTQETMADGRVVRLARDPSGNLSALAPPGRPEHSFGYTPRDEVSAYRPPPVGAESGQETFGYNLDRQPQEADRADGQSIGFEYDAFGRLGGLELATGDRGYGYDAAGRPTALSTPATALSFSYDGALPTGSTWSGAIAGSVTRAFDDEFRVISQSVSGTPAIAISYNADSLPVQVGAMALTRSPETGLITAAALGAFSDSRSFDSRGELIDLTARLGAGVLYAFHLTRDALGAHQRKDRDDRRRLPHLRLRLRPRGTDHRVRRYGALIATYVYDSNGNRTSSTGPGGAVDAAYDAQDRLTQYGAVAFTHTPDGERRTRTAAGQTTTYRYDSLGRLSGVRCRGDPRSTTSSTAAGGASSSGSTERR